MWLRSERDLYVLLYEGMSLDRVLRSLGLSEIRIVGFFDDSSAGRTGRATVVLSSGFEVEILEDSLVLRAQYGSFTFEKPAGKSGPGLIGPIRPDTRLTGWSVKGLELKASVYEDEQLSLIAAASDPERGSINLIVEGIPYFNPLYCAAVYGRVEVIRTLIARGASLAPQMPGAFTALHAAAEHSRIEAAEALLAAGLDIDGLTAQGVTPLMAAVDGPRERTAVFRLDDGTSREEGILNMAPLFFRMGVRERLDVDAVTARRDAQEQTALYLLSRGADSAPRRDNGETVLFSVSRRGLLRVLEELLDRGIDAEVQDDRGETAVFASVRADQPAALDRLLRYGASWRHKNHDGQTPKGVAKKNRTRDCVGLLEYREPLHWSLAAAVSLSSSTVDGCGWSPGLGGQFGLHIRLLRLLTLTGEVGYAIRGTEADLSDTWLVSTFGSPYYEYQHLDAACLLDFALVQRWAWRTSVIAGLGFHLQTSAIICTDSGAWEPIDVNDHLNSSGLGGFLHRGVLAGVELRYMRTLGSNWTSQGGGLSSWSLLIKVGS